MSTFLPSAFSRLARIPLVASRQPTYPTIYWSTHFCFLFLRPYLEVYSRGFQRARLTAVSAPVVLRCKGPFVLIWDKDSLLYSCPLRRCNGNEPKPPGFFSKLDRLAPSAGLKLDIPALGSPPAFFFVLISFFRLGLRKDGKPPRSPPFQLFVFSPSRKRSLFFQK